MQRKQGRSRHEHDDHREGDDDGGGGDECANKKAKAGPGICDDVLHGISSSLTPRDAARCAALSKRHRQIIGGLDFWLLQRRLGPPLPRPHIAYMATVGASESGPLPSAVLRGSMFLDFHLAGGNDGGGLRYSLIDRDRRYRRYVGTCNGIILMAPESFDRCASILVFNPAVAGSEQVVSLHLPGPPGEYRVAGFGYGPSSRLHKLLLTREERDLPVPAELAWRRRANLGLWSTLSAAAAAIYLLLAGRSRVLAFDVDDESVTAIDGGERGPLKPWKLMDVSGHLCASTGHANLALWLLTADRQWVRLCEFWCGGGSATDLAGAWDCAGVLLLYFMSRSSKMAHLHMYDTRKDEELRGSAVGPFLPRAVAEQEAGKRSVLRLPADARVDGKHRRRT
ncbi:hypothetical protein PVAP13_7KG325800 [Panicum virgatum]|uniref:F-box protein n=1 Tax=Panicum virgatum TaxID=38727 RepID=A0A8T0QGX7_PANVG|nr:hypothetical protein PVAP13_7KG325800 [Panicum virgatum]